MQNPLIYSLHCVYAGALLCLCANCFCASAEPKRFTVDVWGPNTRVHPPQSSIIAITQTRDGYLWVGTRDGLARFDGVQFTTFNEGNTPSLKSSPIVKLFEDSHTNLWVATEAAGIFLVKDGRVYPLDIGRVSPERRLVQICEDTNGTVWMSLASGELAQYRNGRVTTREMGQVRGLVTDNSGQLWTGNQVATKLAAKLALAGWPRDKLPQLEFLAPSTHSGIWCFANSLIYKFRDGDFELFAAYHWNPAAAPITSVVEDPNGNLVVGTAGDGIFWFDTQTGEYVHVSSGTSSGLSHSTVFCLCFDREGNLWVGTNGGGLNRVRSQSFDVLDCSKGATVQTVCEDADGGLWLGYNGERIDHWSKGVAEQFRNAQGLYDVQVRAILEDSQHQVWAGTYGGRGLLQLRGGLFLQAPGAAESFGWQPAISALYQDRSNHLWVGLQGRLARLDGNEWNLTNLGCASFVRCITEGSVGALWTGTDGDGLCRIENGRRDWFGRTNGLPSDSVNCLNFDGNGVLWAGTAGGLARFSGGKWTSFDRYPDLAGGIGFLLEDNNHYLWMGTASGLKRVSKQALEGLAAGSNDPVLVRSYGQADGLPTAECTQGSQPSACRARNGKLWFPTTLGLASVDLSRLTRNTNPPPVLIESVYIDGELQGSNSLRAPVVQALTLPANKESLEIHYTSLNFSAPEEGRFKYRLEGHETAWTIHPGTVRYARYSRLPHGSYRFQVTACNEDEVWNNVGASLAVTVLPPFWQTSWFIALVSLALLAMVAGTVHFVSTQKLQRQLAALRQQEALERERARIARDLHDQLGANLTQVALLGEMAETDKNIPSDVEDHARQISQTARETTRALDEIVWTVNPSNDTLDGLINYICKYAQEYLALAGLRYRLEVPPQLPNTPISPELRHNVFLVAKEAVNNIVKHSKASSAWLRLTLDSQQFVLEIEDDGKGLEPQDAQKGRSGLRNMRKRMEDIGGAFEIQRRPEGGTRLRLTAPLAKDSHRSAPEI